MAKRAVVDNLTLIAFVWFELLNYVMYSSLPNAEISTRETRMHSGMDETRENQRNRDQDRKQVY